MCCIIKDGNRWKVRSVLSNVLIEKVFEDEDEAIKEQKLLEIEEICEFSD
jgi:hypothetical protein